MTLKTAIFGMLTAVALAAPAQADDVTANSIVMPTGPEGACITTSNPAFCDLYGTLNLARVFWEDRHDNLDDSQKNAIVSGVIARLGGESLARWHWDSAEKKQGDAFNAFMKVVVGAKLKKTLHLMEGPGEGITLPTTPKNGRERFLLSYEAVKNPNAKTIKAANDAALVSPDGAWGDVFGRIAALLAINWTLSLAVILLIAGLFVFARRWNGSQFVVKQEGYRPTRSGPKTPPTAKPTSQATNEPQRTDG